MRDSRADALLEWYDAHARVLPWRVGPAARRAGEVPDPYRVWMSEIMLQQTTVAAVKDYFRRFTERWPDVHALAAAEEADVLAAWAGLGYYARARNLVRCARSVSGDLGGAFPDQASDLRKLPGIGAYTSAAIAAIAFDRPETVVDGNVERVMARMFAVEAPLPGSKKDLAVHAAALTPQARPGDYAQGVMDLGATICTPRSPACGICPWRVPCKARVEGIAGELPRKTPKQAKPVRLGIAYVGRRRDGAWLLETRPPSGLLGGMLGWPGSDWGPNPEPAPPIATSWEPIGEVRHTFTHFHLRLVVMVAWAPEGGTPSRGSFVAHEVFRPASLPTVMRKVYDLATNWFAKD